MLGESEAWLREVGDDDIADAVCFCMEVLLVRIGHFMLSDMVLWYRFNVRLEMRKAEIGVDWCNVLEHKLVRQPGNLEMSSEIHLLFRVEFVRISTWFMIKSNRNDCCIRKRRYIPNVVNRVWTFKWLRALYTLVHNSEYFENTIS